MDRRGAEMGSILKPENIDFHVDENRQGHHTFEYAMDGLIVRRGQEFKISVTFDRPYEKERDKLVLQLSTGARPQASKGTLIRVNEGDYLFTSSWGMRIDHVDGSTVSLTVMSPADALVGMYSVYLETITKKKGGQEDWLRFKKNLNQTIVVLFNAWCKDDLVYMEPEEHRQEYVLNDRGRIWVGSAWSNRGIPWYFGQFESVSLKTCLHLLQTCDNMKQTARGNPVHVCRIVTQMVNYNDGDDGVLVGNWCGSYPSPTTAPSAWTGSVAILDEYDRTHDGVKYGQCWVFSGLVTTLLRAIGIPTRSVTNFDSAHDTDASMTIDFHFDKDGNPISYLNDSVWNFHVWNESYFDRQDLPKGYKGWQAIDATPQELSDGVHCCGPCPVNAIKSGYVYLPYDTAFVFGEVNGDRVYWDVDDTGEMTVAAIDKHSVGKCISTKSINSNDREDLTLQYKYKEGSKEERNAVRRANKFSSRKDANIYSKPPSHDVTFEFIPPITDVMVGSDFEVTWIVKNTSNQQRTINFTMTTKMVFYTGILAQDLDTLRDEIVIPSDTVRKLVLPVPAADYIGKAPSDACVKVFLKAKVMETGQEFHAIDTVELAKPAIQAQLPEEILEGQKFDVKVFFTNPLPIKLTNGVFKIESSRHLSPDTITKPLLEPVNPQEQASTVVTLEDGRQGWRWLDVCFYSDQLSGIRGEIDFKVTT